MVLLLLPLSPATLDLLRAYDNAICVVFLVDFGLSLKQAPSKRGYVVGERGWLDSWLDPRPPAASGGRAAASGPAFGSPASPAGSAGRTGSELVARRRPQPGAVRRRRHCPGGLPRPGHRQRRRVQRRAPRAGREHRHRLGRFLVGHRDHHHGRLRRPLPDHGGGTDPRHVRHGDGPRDHRRPGQPHVQPARHPGSPATPAATRRRPSAPAGEAAVPIALERVLADLRGRAGEPAGRRWPHSAGAMKRLGGPPQARTAPRRAAPGRPDTARDAAAPSQQRSGNAAEGCPAPLRVDTPDGVHPPAGRAGGGESATRTG